MEGLFGRIRATHPVEVAALILIEPNMRGDMPAGLSLEGQARMTHFLVGSSHV